MCVAGAVNKRNYERVITLLYRFQITTVCSTPKNIRGWHQYENVLIRIAMLRTWGDKWIKKKSALLQCFGTSIRTNQQQNSSLKEAIETLIFLFTAFASCYYCHYEFNCFEQLQVLNVQKPMKQLHVQNSKHKSNECTSYLITNLVLLSTVCS